MRGSHAVLALVLAGCGRIGFAALGGGGGGGAAGDGGATDAPPATGPAGPRYMIVLDANARPSVVSGVEGSVAVAEQFVGATTLAGTALTGHAQFESWGLVWLDPTGAPGATSVLDSAAICDLRELAPTSHGVLAVGLTQATTANPAYGACALATQHQDAMAIAVDAAGGQRLAAHVVSSTFNIQSWHASDPGDGTFALDGIYGGTGTFGTAMLPMAGADENAYFARVDATTGDPVWLATIYSTAHTYAGPIDASGGDTCVMGAFSGSVTVFGTALASAGMDDAWVARIDPTGAPRFVRQIGTPGEESTTDGTSIAATADGGCVAALEVPDDLALDGTSLPVAAGAGVLLHFDATGALVSGIRTTGAVQLARLGSRIFAALPCSGPCAVGGAGYTPAGHDIALFSLGGGGAQVLAGITGGAQALIRLAAVPPDALAVLFSAAAGPTKLEALAIAPPAPSTALAVIGVGP